jgi:3-hydroxyisobutyrate dehydrogenase-like beta-hydroxyacid dehydrogenase
LRASWQRTGRCADRPAAGQIATVAIAEALVFGKKAGLDPKKIFEVVSVSTGNSVQFQNRVPRMLARNFAARRCSHSFSYGIE